MPTTIYALCEPDLQVPVIRYIGMTKDLPARYCRHLSESVNKPTHLGHWLRSLSRRGDKPVLMTLCEVPVEQGCAAERLYIRLAREGGMELVNSTEGGEGVVNPSEQTRHKQGSSNRGKAKSPEVRAKISASLRGSKSPAFGKSPSEATRQKLREWQIGSRSPRFGKKLSPETRHRMTVEQTLRWAYRKSPLFIDGGGI